MKQSEKLNKAKEVMNEKLLWENGLFSALAGIIVALNMIISYLITEHNEKIGSKAT